MHNTRFCESISPLCSWILVLRYWSNATLSFLCIRIQSRDQLECHLCWFILALYSTHMKQEKLNPKTISSCKHWEQNKNDHSMQNHHFNLTIACTIVKTNKTTRVQKLPLEWKKLKDRWAELMDNTCLRSDK